MSEKEMTWKRLANKVVELLLAEDNETENTHYSYYFDKEGVEVLARCMRKANDSLLWKRVGDNA